MRNLNEKQFGRWQVVCRDQSNKRASWLCRCECGKEKIVLEQNLINNMSRSCGCLSVDKSWRGCGEISGNYWHRLELDAQRRNLEFSVSITEAWELYLIQDRLCALSHEPISFSRRLANGKWRGDEQTASLDRIDSSKPYLLGNVQWVHKDVNRMKQNLQEVRFLQLCERITNAASRIREKRSNQTSNLVR